MVDVNHRHADATGRVLVLARQRMNDRRAQRMLAGRALAALADRGLQRRAVAVAELDAPPDRDVVDRDAGILAEQVVGRFGDGDVADHRAQNVLRRRRGLARGQRGEALLDVGRQDLQRPDVEFLGDVFDEARIDAKHALSIG